MGRTAGTLMYCVWCAVCLQACGNALPQTPTWLDAEAQAHPVQAPRPGPTLEGRATRRVRSRSARAIRASPHPRATVDEHACISIPDGATWATVKAALYESARRRAAREKLSYDTPMLVSLPGVPGYVIVGGRPEPCAVGLSLTLAGTAQAPSTRVDALGTAWVTERGCDTQLRWGADAWSLAIWETALGGLKELKGASEHSLRVQADNAVPAAAVLPFLTAAHEARLGAPYVYARPGYRYDDVVDDSLRWLAAHQLPNGGWNDELTLAYCDGLRMKDVSVTGKPERIHETGLTSLAVCAFLGAGYTNRGKHPFARVVSRGLRYLKNCQLPDGLFEEEGDGTLAVGHGWATLAMVEAYGMTGSPIFKRSAQRSLDALGPTWRGSGDDPLATALTAMSLRSAQIINADRVKRGKKASLVVEARLAKQLHTVGIALGAQGADFRTASGLWTRILLGDEPDEHGDIHAGALRLVAAVRAAGAQADPGLTWLVSLIAYQIGGKEVWAPMREALTQHTIALERKGGHACCLRGSWDPRPDPSMPGGRTAATVLHALSLQRFYRYSCTLHKR